MLKWFSISNEELFKNPPLEDTAKCFNCGRMHKIKYAEGESNKTESKTTSLAFINCDEGNKQYLVGIDGKQIFN